ncbi:MAG: MMPL family transporter [Candidatus Gracilibacteria bacterium]
MQEKNGLLEKMKDRENLTRREISRLNFSYVGDEAGKQKLLIAEALAFWRLVKESDLALYERVWPEAFLSDENRLIRLVAMIVLMPTVPWRRILWRYNIDFQSRESFLRRLKPEQLEAIEANFADLAAERIPRAFSRWEVFTRGITVAKLKNHEIQHPVGRDQTKSAWSFNLKPFDFGFNAYPNGDRDDQAEFFVSTKKFLSAKSHENDFVVDKEFGGYWWLYRKARSNFVWRPNRSVELKQNICPGFWWTIIVHLWFWVISPALFIWEINTIHVSTSALQAQSWLNPTLLPFALLTPLWLFSALCRLIAQAFTWLVEDVLSENTVLYIKIGAMVFFTLFMALILISFMAVIYSKLVPVFGKLCTILLLLLAPTTIGVSGYKAYCKEENKKFPRKVKIAWVAQLILTLLVLTIVFHSQVFAAIVLVVSFLGHLIVRWGTILINDIKSIGLYWLVLAFPVGITLLTLITLRLSPEKQEKVFIALEKIAPYVVVCSICSLAALVMYSAGPLVGLLFLAIALLFSVASIRMMKEQNPARQKTKLIELYVRNKVSRHLRLPYELYLQNKKLLALPPEEQQRLLEESANLVHNLFYRCKYTEQLCYRQFVLALDHDTLERIKSVEDRLISQDEAIKERIFELLLNDPNMSFRNALRLARDGQKKREERKQKITASLKQIAGPFIFIWEVLCKLRFLYEQFNKRCPFIERPKNLWY